MARRNDHHRDDLKKIIHQTATEIIQTQGISGLTARALAHKIGYSLGTIYNVYPDMDALKQDINLTTLQLLHQTCINGLSDAGTDALPRLKKLALIYVDFAKDNHALWQLLFALPVNPKQTERQWDDLPTPYQDQLQKLFGLIEENLQIHPAIPKPYISKLAKLLWVSLHGFSMLCLDGRVSTLGLGKAEDLVALLLNQFDIAPKTKA